MKAIGTHASVWALGLTILWCATASADHLPCSVAVTDIRTMDVEGGRIQYSDVLVQSFAAEASTKSYRVNTSLWVKDASGVRVCEVGSILVTKIRPPIFPHRFQVQYPAPPPLSVKMPQPQKLVMKKYIVFAEILVNEADTNQALADHKTERVLFFYPGTPSCKILMTKGQ